MAMTTEEFQAFQEALEKGREIASTYDQHEMFARYEKQAILQAYGLVGEVREDETTLKSKFDAWVDHCLVAKLEERIKEDKYFYQNILCYGKKKQKEFSWQQMTNIILSYDSGLVHRLAQNHVKIRKVLTTSLKERLEQTTNNKDQEKIKKQLTSKRLLADKIVYEMLKAFKVKEEKQKGRLCLNEKTAKGYLENTIDLYEMLAGSDGLGEFAPIFDNVTSRTQDFWKTNPKELHTLLTKLKTNVYEKGEKEQSLSTKEIISISKRCGTFFKESDAKKLEKVAHGFMQFKNYILNEFLSKGGDNHLYDKIDNLTFKDLLIQAPTIGCKDSSAVKFNVDLLMGKAFKESLKDAKVKTNEPTHYLFKEFGRVKVNGDHHELANLLLKAPTSVCTSPYTIVDIVNFVDKTFKESRYGHSNIKEKLLTVHNFSDLNLVRIKDIDKENCLKKLTTLFREEKLFEILQRDLTLLNIKEDVLVEELRHEVELSKGDINLEDVVIRLVKKCKKQQLKEDTKENDEVLTIENEEEDALTRQNGKRSKDYTFILSIPDYEKMLEGLGFEKDQIHHFVEEYRLKNKAYFEEQERIKQENEEYEKGFNQLVEEYKQIQQAEEQIQQQLKKQAEELAAQKEQNNIEEKKALAICDQLIAGLQAIIKEFDTKEFEKLSYENKATYLKTMLDKKRSINQMYVASVALLNKYDLTEFVNGAMQSFYEIQEKAQSLINGEVKELQDRVRQLDSQREKINKEKIQIEKLIEKKDNIEENIILEYYANVADQVGVATLEPMQEMRKEVEEELLETAKDSDVFDVFLKLGFDPKLLSKSMVKARKTAKTMTIELKEPIQQQIVVNSIESIEGVQQIQKYIQKQTMSKHCGYRFDLDDKTGQLTITITIYAILPMGQIENFLTLYTKKQDSGQRKLEDMNKKANELIDVINRALQDRFPKEKTMEGCFKAWNKEIDEVEHKANDDKKTLNQYIEVEDEIKKLIEEMEE